MKANYSIQVESLRDLSPREFLPTAKGLVEIFNAIPSAEKNKYTALYAKIGEFAFDKNIEIPGHNLTKYKKDSTKNTRSSDSIIVKTVNSGSAIQECFKANGIVITGLQNVLLLKIQEQDGTPLLLGITDHPKLISRDTVSNEFTYKPIGLDNIIENFGHALDDSNYGDVYVIIGVSSVLPREIVKTLIERCSKSGNCLMRLDLELKDDNFEIVEHQCEEKRLVDIACSIFSITINNRALSADEIEILKLSFEAHKADTIEYEIVSSGHSGSTVIRAITSNAHGTPVPSVLKLCKNNKRDKLDIEKANFLQFVDQYSRRYKMRYEETDKMTAIIYPFASEDSRIAAQPFASLLKNNDWDLDLIIQIVNKGYDIDLMKAWKQKVEHVQTPFKLVYKDYIKSFADINTIVDLRGGRDGSNDFISIASSISENEYPSLRKICHGDYHTENLFVDINNNIEPIDFGKTSFHHAPIDHIALECSLKYNHVPKYCAIEDLRKFEQLLLRSDSFGVCQQVGDLPPILTKYFLLINAIRKNAMDSNYISDVVKQSDYLRGLFLMTIRQIEYPNLNQNFAIESSIILAKHFNEKP